MKGKILLMIFFVILSLFFQDTFAQNFTKITTGPLVNDGGESEACAWGDYDNDGDLDLFVSNGLFNSQKNFLYRNEGTSSGYTFTKITEGNVVNDTSGSRAASWGDYDNDGDIDLFVANQTGNSDSYLYENNGNGTFTKITDGAIVNDGGLSDPAGWVDYNNDGYLDIFVGNYDEVNFLYKNNTDKTFTRITEGEIVTDIEFTIGHAWGDFDHDGDSDLFIGNREGLNSFYLNNGDETFTKITNGIIVNDPGAGSGGSWVDYDNDQDLDLFVSVTWTNETNDLYQNNGLDNDYTFTKITTGDIATDTVNFSYSSWADFDNDGDLDCFVANFGDFSFSGQLNFLYSNNRDGTFTKIMEGDIVNEVSTSVGCAWGDYDNDGDMDLYVCNTLDNNNLFYRNDNDNGNKWLKIQLIGMVSNTSGIGARIKARAITNTESVWQTRVIEGQTGELGQNSLIAHFGLGLATIVDSLKIEWPSGIVQVLEQVAVDTLLIIEEDTTAVTSVAEIKPNIPSEFSLVQNYPNPFNPETVIRYSLAEASTVSLKIYNIQGQLFSTLFEGENPAGEHSYIWNGKDQKGNQVTSGIYFYRLESISHNGQKFIETRKMSLIR